MPAMDSVTSSQPYLRGSLFGWPDSVRVHRLANIAGQCEVGEHTRIDAFVTITGRVRIGKNCHIATGVAIFGGFGSVHDDAGVVIGDAVALSPGVKVFTETTDLASGLITGHVGADLERASFGAPVVIDRYASVGANSVVLPGVHIYPGVQVGALSLVRESLAAGFVYAGCPCRVVSVRPPLKYADA